MYINCHWKPNTKRDVRERYRQMDNINRYLMKTEMLWNGLKCVTVCTTLHLASSSDCKFFPREFACKVFRQNSQGQHQCSTVLPFTIYIDPYCITNLLADSNWIYHAGFFFQVTSLLDLPSISEHHSNTHLHPARSLYASTIMEWITFPCLSLITRCRYRLTSGSKLIG